MPPIWKNLTINYVICSVAILHASCASMTNFNGSNNQAQEFSAPILSVVYLEKHRENLNGEQLIVDGYLSYVKPTKGFKGYYKLVHGIITKKDETSDQECVKIVSSFGPSILWIPNNELPKHLRKSSRRRVILSGLFTDGFTDEFMLSTVGAHNTGIYNGPLKEVKVLKLFEHIARCRALSEENS